MACRGKQEQTTAARAFDIEAKAFVGFFIKQRVRRNRTDTMPVEPVGAFRNFILNRVEERLVVSSPGHARDTLHFFSPDLTVAQVFQMKRVLAEASDIRRVGHPLVVITDLKSV